MPNFGFEAGQILPTLTTLMAMLGGTMFAIWLGEMITEDGIGQGISLIIFGGIVSGILPNIAQMFAMPDMAGKIFTIVSFIHNYFTNDFRDCCYPRRPKTNTSAIWSTSSWA